MLLSFIDHRNVWTSDFLWNEFRLCSSTKTFSLWIVLSWCIIAKEMLKRTLVIWYQHYDEYNWSLFKVLCFKLELKWYNEMIVWIPLFILISLLILNPKYIHSYSSMHKFILHDIVVEQQFRFKTQWSVL